MMSWQPRMIARKPLILGPRGLLTAGCRRSRSGCARRAASRARPRLPRTDRRPGRRSRFSAGLPRHHHALEAHRLDALEVGDALLRPSASRSGPCRPSRSGSMAAIALEPAVVGVEAGLLVVEVGMVADHHADRRIDDLGSDAVPVLVGQPRLWGPSRRDAGPRISRRPCAESLGGMPAAATRPSGTGAFMPSTTKVSPMPSLWTERAAHGRGTPGSMWST
mgnify:CR=1 FL=1